MEWDGQCLDLVDELLHSHPDGHTLWINNPTPHWTFHAALVLDGIVHAYPVDAQRFVTRF